MSTDVTYFARYYRLEESVALVYVKEFGREAWMQVKVTKFIV